MFPKKTKQINNSMSLNYDLLNLPFYDLTLEKL